MAPLFHVEALLPSSLSPKLSSLLQSHVYPRVGHVFRALARFKSLLLDALSKKRRSAPSPSYHSRSAKTSKIAGLTKPHLVWVGDDSPARAKPSSEMDSNGGHVRSCYESTWNVVVPAPAEVEGGGAGEDEYCGYLCWLEEETPDDAEDGGEDDADGGGAGSNGTMNEIDRLAEKFIARCHAKFLLEKQESYRRYQEMMARSV
ncbi:hypothetical protein ACP70R_010505 [Stipagrostis hirtigluma subsp. patula]